MSFIKSGRGIGGKGKGKLHPLTDHESSEGE